ncbi:Pyruvate kinase [Phytophthora nicotianae]|uniref:Pyruvate kinase n=1 Tax=Phytophthora nicotianae TaxID=4792 RepID=A0A0W8DS03_PHYNI|nr:Pyruvate kinase [Phytophthora nicotianae]
MESPESLRELEEKPKAHFSEPDTSPRDVDPFDKRLTRMTTATISSSSYFDSGDGTRYRSLEEEMKAPPPPAPLSIDEEERVITSPRVQTVQSASNVLALASRSRSNDSLSASVPMRRFNSSASMMQAAMEREAIYGGQDQDPVQDFNNYAIVVVFPTDNAGSLSARTLRDEELILPLVERLNRARPVQTVEADDTIGGTTRAKPKHRSRPPVKFVLKGVYSGYLQKASSRDPTLWRKRWFIIKGDQLLYCKSNVNQQDVTSISLLGAVLAKAKPEVAVNRSEQESYVPSAAEPSLLERVLSREDTLKLFRDFVFTTQFQSLLDTWIECELFRRSCLARENGLVTSAGMANRRTPQDEWDHLKDIIRAIQLLNIVHADDLNQLRQSFQTEQSNRRLSVSMNSDGFDEYPRTDVIVPVQRKLFKAIEAGPFQQFLLQNGYRLLLERTIGTIA